MVGDQNVNPPDGTLAAANWKPESALASGATSPTSPSCKENRDNQIQTTGSATIRYKRQAALQSVVRCGYHQ